MYSFSPAKLVRLRWTEEAAKDLEHIADYLFAHTPSNAARMIRTIYDAPYALVTFPYRGRAGKKHGTREMVLPSLPYIVVYTIDANLIQVIRILHGAQEWP